MLGTRENERRQHSEQPKARYAARTRCSCSVAALAPCFWLSSGSGSVPPLLHSRIHVLGHFVQLLQQNTKLLLQRRALRLEHFVLLAEIRNFLFGIGDAAAANCSLGQRADLLTYACCKESAAQPKREAAAHAPS